MKEIERVRGFLREKSPYLEIIVLDEDTSTAPLAARALGLEVGQIAKSILFKDKDGRFFMVVATGDSRVDARKMKRLVGTKTRMAHPGEVLEITGYHIGGVCPFDLNGEVAIYLDESLKRYDVVYAAAGAANTALPVNYEELMRITGGIPCQVSII